ncbi:hypothetical protein F5B21DRAFT_483159 [Xylaria acuta]|nr:hypothetical protein F5B21DRAFT_483159 [Xylaria acuta]
MLAFRHPQQVVTMQHAVCREESGTHASMLVGSKTAAPSVLARRRSRIAEDLEIRGASRSERAGMKFTILARFLGLVHLALTLAVNPARGVRVGLIHLLAVLFEVNGTLVVRRDVAPASLLSAVAVSAPSRALVRLIPHRVPPLVPMAAVSVALHQRHLGFMAPWVGSSVVALLEPILQLAGAVVKTEVDLPAHFSHFEWEIGRG